MPLHQRPSANVGKRTTMAQSGSYYISRPNHTSQVPHQPAERVHEPEVEVDEEEEDYESELLDELNKANTELNKSNAEKDKLKTALEAAEKKLAETVTAYRELKAQHEGARNENEVLKEDIRQLNTDNSRLEFERRDFEQQFIAIHAKHENLSMRFSALSATAPPSAMTSPLPQEQPEQKPERIERTERSKTSSRPSSKASGSSGKSTTSIKSPTKKDREERHERHREERHREDRPREERRREKTDKEREQRDKEKSEAKAEKVRLSKRFDERPALSGRQTSFIEPWGPGAKSGRSHSSVVSSSHHSAYANVPRTTTISLSAHTSSDSSNFDDDAYEDGNYHPYPIVN